MHLASSPVFYAPTSHFRMSTYVGVGRPCDPGQAILGNRNAASGFKSKHGRQTVHVMEPNEKLSVFLSATSSPWLLSSQRRRLCTTSLLSATFLTPFPSLSPTLFYHSRHFAPPAPTYPRHAPYTSYPLSLPANIRHTIG